MSEFEKPEREELGGQRARDVCYESQLIGRCSFIDFNCSECRLSKMKEADAR